ncbi:hypothetical protein SLS62_010414 [Diatrype stigma]|uniref:Uncharacterized protein n=1 Tax=Diatrype stigma TaxID=117547 RepID=A0AAN9UC85_9PEZI
MGTVASTLAAVTFLSAITSGAAERWKIEIDHLGAKQCKDGNDILYADDLTGCSVAAASWNSGSQIYGVFMHLCGTTIQDEATFDQITEDESRGEDDFSMVESWENAIASLGQPAKVNLIRSVDASGNELFPAGNQRIIKFLQDIKIQTNIDTTKTYRSNANAATVELHPYDDDQILLVQS